MIIDTRVKNLFEMVPTLYASLQSVLTALCDLAGREEEDADGA